MPIRVIRWVGAKKVTIISHRWEIMGKDLCIPLENP